MVCLDFTVFSKVKIRYSYFPGNLILKLNKLDIIILVYSQIIFTVLYILCFLLFSWLGSCFYSK